MSDTTSLCLNVKTGGAIVIDGRIWVRVMRREPRVVTLSISQAIRDTGWAKLRSGGVVKLSGIDDTTVQFIGSSQTSQTRLRVSAPRSVSIKLEIDDA